MKKNTKNFEEKIQFLTRQKLDENGTESHWKKTVNKQNQFERKTSSLPVSVPFENRITQITMDSIKSNGSIHKLSHAVVVSQYWKDTSNTMFLGEGTKTD